MNLSAVKIALVAVLVVLLAGCGGAGDNGSARTEANQGEPYLRCVLDYQPVKGPRAMARVSDFVIRGRIGKPRPGLVHYKRDGSVAQVETDILPVRKARILFLPKLPRVSNRAYPAIPTYPNIEICAVGGPDSAAALGSLEGRPIVAYLVYKKSRGKLPPRTSYPGRKHPPSPRFAPLPEGLLIENSSGDGVYGLQLGEEFPGAKLSDFYPDRKSFPPTDSTTTRVTAGNP